MTADYYTQQTRQVRKQTTVWNYGNAITDVVVAAGVVFWDQ